MSITTAEASSWCERILEPFTESCSDGQCSCGTESAEWSTDLMDGCTIGDSTDCSMWDSEMRSMVSSTSDTVSDQTIHK